MNADTTQAVRDALENSLRTDWRKRLRDHAISWRWFGNEIEIVNAIRRRLDVNPCYQFPHRPSAGGHFAVRFDTELGRIALLERDFYFFHRVNFGFIHLFSFSFLSRGRRLASKCLHDDQASDSN